MIDAGELVGTYVDLTRRDAEASNILATSTGSQSTMAATEPKLQPVPSDIDVEYWQEEEDGSWIAHAPLLGVTAVADTEARVFVEAAEQVAEFWEILNERYETLSENLKELLSLRFQNLRFVPRRAATE
jgi:hypothetical protein